MLNTIENVNAVINDFVWGVPAMICIIGVGLYLSFSTHFIQLRKFNYAIKMTLGKAFQKSEAAEGSTTPFQSLCTALAATVGTGNIAGVAGAIAIGGPGAVFWMWISAFLGMCTKFSEVTLAVHFREKNIHGDWVGGPMYYIKNGLSANWQWLAVAFSGFGVLTVFGTGNATQVNTITTAIDSALLNFNVISTANMGIINLIIGIIITILVALVLLGGIKRIGKVTEILVPFMALFYIILALGVVFLNIKHLPSVFGMIFTGAFSPSAVTGGVVGSMFMSLKKGFSRGIFSNEAGLGTGSIAHASADVNHPVKQGLFGIFEVFADTIVICTLTALVILCSGIKVNYGVAAGAELTISGFTSAYGGWITLFTAIALCCFAFSTVLGWGLYGTRCIEFLFGSKIIKPFIIVYSLVAIVGATADLGMIWSIAETFNGLMAIPNLIALFLLGGTVVKLVKEYFSNPAYEDDNLK
nr:sodium:alanine symporter family protein [uncultured Aminipila sp.]